METQCQYLTMTQRNELLKLSQRLEDLFDGMIDTWKTDLVDFGFKKDVKPICFRPYPLLKLHAKMFKKQVEFLVLLGVLGVANNS